MKTMRTIILLLVVIASILSIGLMAGNNNYLLKEHPEKYCAKLQDGKLAVIHRGEKISADVSLANGIKIKTDGTVIKKDGSEVLLKEGECISKDGKIMEEKPKVRKEI